MTREVILSIGVSVRLVASAQLSGVHTVGPGGDFPDLTAAVDASVAEGLSDSTTFVVWPGGEPIWPLTIGPIPGATAQSPLVIVSSSLDSTAIDIGTVRFEQTAHVIVDGFTISTTVDPEQAAVVFYRSQDVWLRRCRLLEVGVPDYDYFTGLIEFDLPWEGPAASHHLKRCSAISADVIVKSNGAYGNTTFDACILAGYFDMTAGHHRTFDDCDITSTYCDDVGTDHFRRCSIHSPSGVIRIKAQLIQDCEFTCTADLAAGQVFSNRMRNVEMIFGSQTLFVDNDVDTMNSSFAHYAKLIGNRFHGPVDSDGDHMQHYNNSFDAGLTIYNGPGQVVRYNNFAPGTELRTWYCGGQVEFNSLWHVRIEQPSITHLKGNNYAGSTNVDLYYMSFDERATFYDPAYVDTAGYWHATNSLLTGKSTLFGTYGQFDIDSVARSLPCDASANIICWGAMDMPDTLQVQCGDRIAPKICEGQDGLQLSPLPADGVIDEDVLALGTGFYLFMTDTNASALDSCWITYAPYPDGQTIQLYSYCGFPVDLNPSVPWFADSTLWSPTPLFEDAHDPYQVFSSDSSVLLTSTVYSAQCGELQQFFQVNISQAPLAWFSLEQFDDSVTFVAHEDCCDSIQWAFDDGTYSVEAATVHVYEEPGTYQVTLTCWVQGDSGVTYNYVVVQVDGILEVSASPLLLFPNPASDHVRIEWRSGPGAAVNVEVFDLLGRRVMDRTTDLPTDLELRGLGPGEYILQVRAKDRAARVPLIIGAGP